MLCERMPMAQASSLQTHSADLRKRQIKEAKYVFRQGSWFWFCNSDCGRCLYLLEQIFHCGTRRHGAPPVQMSARCTGPVHGADHFFACPHWQPVAQIFVEKGFQRLLCKLLKLSKIQQLTGWLACAAGAAMLRQRYKQSFCCAPRIAFRQGRSLAVQARRPCVGLRVRGKHLVHRARFALAQCRQLAQARGHSLGVVAVALQKLHAVIV